MEASVVQVQLVEAVAKVLVLPGINGKQAAEDDWHGGHEA